MYSTTCKILLASITLFITVQGQPANLTVAHGQNEGRPEAYSSLHSNNGGFYCNDNVHDAKSLLNDTRIKMSSYLPLSITGDTLRSNFSYNDFFWLDEMTSQSLQNNVWINFEKNTCSYDSQGNMTLALFQIWNNNSWLVENQRTCQYDNNGNLLALFQDFWNGTTLSHDYRIFYTYDNNNNLISQLKESWLNNDWVNNSRLTWTYDSNNNQLTRLFEYFQDGSWKNYELHNWEYDNNSYCISWTYQYADGAVWINSEHEIYTNNSFGNLLNWNYYQWVNNNWLLVERGDFTYDSSQNMLSKLFQYLDNGNWLDYARYNYTYDSHGNAVYGEFLRKSDGSAWYSDWGSIYLYYNNMTDFNVIRAKNASATYLLNPMSIDDENSVKSDFYLNQNFPNPFNPETKITFSIREGGIVNLSVFDILGNLITNLVEESKPQGIYTVSFNASKIPSGVYFYKLVCGDKVQVRKMVILK